MVEYFRRKCKTKDKSKRYYYYKQYKNGTKKIISKKEYKRKRIKKRRIYKQKGGNVLLQGLLPSDKFNPNEIDIVIPWAGEENYIDKDIESNEMESKDRMRNNKELKYCLRSIHKYAPWIRHVYILVNSPAIWPSWLDQSKAEKWISVIDRCKYFEDKKSCPTYNYSAVLANMHKIPELSNWFIMLMDDCFFGNTIMPEDLFTKDGKPYYYNKTPTWGKWAGHGPREVYEESKLKNAIRKTSNKNYTALTNWTKDNPDFMQDDAKQMFYAKAMSKLGKPLDGIDDKVIKNLCNNTKIKEIKD